MSAAELPFVAQPPGLDAATDAAETAAARWGMPAPVLLRSAMNGVFAAGDDVVLRVSRTTAPAGQAVWLAEQLARRGVRVPRHLRAAPLEVDGLAVYAIERLEPSGPIDWTEVGAMVRRVHDWPAGELRSRHPLPRCDDLPWWDIERTMAMVGHLLDESPRAGLRAAIREHGGWRSMVADRVVCHGDVHPGNIVQTARGPVLLDWDLLCVAPRAWDHAVVLTWERRWGGDRGMYRAFADGYGASLEGDPLTESLAVMRNVVATIGRLVVGLSDPAAVAETERRLRFWRGDPTAPQWRPM